MSVTQGVQKLYPKLEIYLDLDPMTFIYKPHLDILETYLYKKNGVCMSRQSKVKP